MEITNYLKKVLSIIDSKKGKYEIVENEKLFNNKNKFIVFKKKFENFSIEELQKHSKKDIFKKELSKIKKLVNEIKLDLNETKIRDVLDYFDKKNLNMLFNNDDFYLYDIVIMKNIQYNASKNMHSLVVTFQNNVDDNDNAYLFLIDVNKILAIYDYDEFQSVNRI
jgi:hypothetical protein